MALRTMRPDQRMALTTMRPDRSVPGVAPSAGGIAVYECRQNGQRVLSDRPCGPDATERVLETGALNTFNEVPPPAVRASRASPPLPVGSPAASGVRQSATAAHDARCEQIEAWKDRIDAAMRRGYTSQQGERLRAEWHRAKQAYYDERCGR